MVELDTQIVPAAHAMSFLFWACSAFKVSKESYVTGAKEIKKQDNRIYEEAKAIMDKIPISGVNAAESDTLKKLISSLPKNSKEKWMLLSRLSKLCNAHTQPYDSNKIFAFSSALSAGGAAFGFYAILQTDSNNSVLSFLFFIFLALTIALFYLSAKMAIGNNEETRKQTTDLFLFAQRELNEIVLAYVADSSFDEKPVPGESKSIYQ